MIVIDFSQIADLGMLKDPRFLSCFENMSQRLSDDSEIEATCIHEAAHFIYMENMGAKDFMFSGPKVTYVDGRFDAEAAHVLARDWKGLSVAIPAQMPDQVTDASALAAIFLAISKAFVAGGVARLKLTAKTDAGDSGDFDNFLTVLKNICRTRNIDMSNSSALIPQFWEIGKTRVMKDLEDEAVQTRIRNKAKEIRPLLFVDVPLVALQNGDPRAPF